MKVFVARGGKTTGPFTPYQIRGKYDRGTLRPDDHIWYEGAAEWMPAYWILEWKEFQKPSAEQRAALEYLYVRRFGHMMTEEAETLIARLVLEQGAERRFATWRERCPKVTELKRWCEESKMPPESACNFYRLQEALQMLQQLDHQRFLRITPEELAATYETIPRMHWEDESATEAQLVWLAEHGVEALPGISKRDASAIISGVTLPPSDGQIRRLTFYGLPLPKTLREASRAIDAYKQKHPESEEPYQMWKLVNKFR